MANNIPRKCWCCGSTRNLHLHHIFFGSANRRKSDEDGLVVYLCINHHTGTNGVHTGNKTLDHSLKCYGQKKYLKTHSMDEWMSRYHKNYLYEENEEDVLLDKTKD